MKIGRCFGQCARALSIHPEYTENRRRRRRRKKEEKANGGIRTSEKFRNHFALETLLVADILLRFDGIRFGRDRGTIVVPKVPAFRYYR